MEGKMVSIIVPVYNLEKFIEQCLRSIIEQTYKHLEILVIDDGSTDQSAKIIKEIANQDARIIYINQENAGVAETRNAGLKNATGSYVVFVDGDDWLDPTCIVEAVKVAESKDLDMVMWPYRKEHLDYSQKTLLFDETEKYWDETKIANLYRRFIGNTKEELRYPEKLDSLCTVWGKLYRKELLENVVFYDKEIIGSTAEDILFNIHALGSMKRAGYISNVFYHYRKTNEQSLTHHYDRNLVNKRKKYYEIIEKHLKQSNLDKTYDEALSNRVALSFIGIGLALIEDKQISVWNKYKEIKRIFEINQYKKAFKQLELSYLPIHWKLFFGFAKKNLKLFVMILLYVMNCLRKG